MMNTFLYSVLFDLHYDVSITGLRTISYAKCLAKLICLHDRHDRYGGWFYLLSCVSSLLFYHFRSASIFWESPLGERRYAV